MNLYGEGSCVKKWLFLILTLLLMGTIFILSGQEGEKSYALSQSVAQRIEKSEASQSVVPSLFSENFHANVRKWAHVYLYALLGVSTALTVLSFAGKVWQRGAVRGTLICIAVSAGICFAYAAGDEFHQSFVPGRACLVTDVFVDAIGFLPGILVVGWFWYRHQLKSKRRTY